ncbi:lysylphosphatidylglycerol synthase domain-containing protein [Comamonas sp. B-9]|uniref:lysylphosphatidylglycerol synthase domain-containing protein n=1 Tax=Comamonas sp. B-9 TaxID=1055192 RepID=UPI00040E0FD0|nr:lysylphosphatidylglycerol synthase domain-containing protein [Comamonas sp. B-9]
MPAKLFSKKYLHLIGGVLGVLGIFFVAARLYKYADQISIAHFSSREIFWMVLAVCVYGAANVLLALAWQKILAFFDAPVATPWAIRAYGVSQLAKYVPGNIFQFAGRQAIGMAAGLEARALLKSTLYELGLLALVGACYGILALPLLLGWLTGWMALLLFIATISALAWGIHHFFSAKLAAAWGMHTLFLLVSGLIFWLILQNISHATPLPVAGVAGAYVLAWLIGLVTPGAPAGVGVREAVLLFLLGAWVPPGQLVFTIVVGRMMTVIGDLLFFGVSCAMKRSPA